MMYLGDERKDGIHMAHMEKFKQVDLVPVLKEGFRDLKEYRNDVDETRTEQNYTFGCQTWKQVTVRAKQRAQEIMGDKKLNKKANPLFSWVVTYPKGRTNVSERDFFEGVRDYMSDLYGEANVMAVCVHMDETTPHCHCYIVPEATSRKTGERTVSTASLLDKKHLQRFHKDFDEFMYERFGERNLIERAEDEKVENVSMLELKKRTLKAENETLTAGNQELKTERRELKNDVSNLKNELRMLEEKRKQELERSQASIDAKISAYKDKRVKELNEELRPLKLRKKRMEDDIKQMTTENWDKYQAFEEYQYWSDLANKAKQAFERFKGWMSEWQLGKVKKEQETYQAKHNPKQKNDDWDMDF